MNSGQELWNKKIDKIFQAHDFDKAFYGPWYRAHEVLRSRELWNLLMVLEKASKEELKKHTNDIYKKMETLSLLDEEKWKMLVDEEVEGFKENNL